MLLILGIFLIGAKIVLDFHCGLASISLVPFWSPFSSFPSSPCLFSCSPSPSSVLLILEIFLIGAKILFDFHCGVDSAVCHSCFPVLLSSLPYVLYWFSSSLLSSFFLVSSSFFSILFYDCLSYTRECYVSLVFPEGRISRICVAYMFSTSA